MSVLRIFVFLMWSHGLFSQAYKITYECKTYGISHGREYEGTNTLIFNRYESIYTHDQWPQEEVTNESNSGVFHIVLSDKDLMPVIFDRRENTMVFKELYRKNQTIDVVRIQEIPNYSWIILDALDTIGGYVVRKAKATVIGREFVAWFSEEIPAPYGPYKLHGLPGLIIEANSLDGKIFYSLKGIEKLADDYTIQKPSFPKVLTDEEYEELNLKQLLISQSNGMSGDYDPPKDCFLDTGCYHYNATFKKNGYKLTLKKKK